MFAIIYHDPGPDGWPTFTGAQAFRAKVFDGYGVALIYKGVAPKQSTAERFGEVLSIQELNKDLHVFLPAGVYASD